MPFKCLASFVLFLYLLSRDKYPEGYWLTSVVVAKVFFSLFVCFFVVVVVVMVNLFGFVIPKESFWLFIVRFKGSTYLRKVCLKRINLKDNQYVKYFPLPTLARS